MKGIILTLDICDAVDYCWLGNTILYFCLLSLGSSFIVYINKRLNYDAVNLFIFMQFSLHWQAWRFQKVR